MTGEATPERPAALARPPLVQRVDYLVAACRGRRVLHLGCANHPYTAAALAEGALLHTRLAEAAAELWGLDADEDGLALLRRQGFARLVRGDLEHLERLAPDAFAVRGAEDFDVIVAGEVIEHLPNPGLFLRGVQALMGPATTLVLTTVNAYCGFRAAVYALRSRGGLVEPVHPDHVAYYSLATLRRLAETCGLEARRALFYDVGREHRPHLRPAPRLINDMLVRLFPQLADGVILECGRPAVGRA
jgi:SAM-dependent methyltransferase